MLHVVYQALAETWLLEANALLPLPPLPSSPPPSRDAEPAAADGADGADAASERACAAVAAQRAAARALLQGLRALRSVTRPGAAPPRVLRMLATLRHCLLQLARRYLLLRRPGRAVAILQRAARVAPPAPAAAPRAPAVLGGAPSRLEGDRDAAERGTMLLLLADACCAVARADEAARRGFSAELGEALADTELEPPEWANAAANAAAANAAAAAAATAAAAAAATASPAAPAAPAAWISAGASPFAATAAPAAAVPPPAPSPGAAMASAPIGGAMSGIAPPMSAFAADAEANYRLSVAHYLAALRIVPQPLLPSARARLRDAYSRLGREYMQSSRYTKARLHPPLPLLVLLAGTLFSCTLHTPLTMAGVPSLPAGRRVIPLDAGRRLGRGDVGRLWACHLRRGRPRSTPARWGARR